MRLSDWRATAKPREALGPKVTDLLQSVLGTLGAEDDPHVWIAWGDDPASRYTVFVPTPPGMVVAAVRVNVPQEGPRVSAKLVRWSKVQPGELALEGQAGHRLLSFQLEQQVMKGIDDDAGPVARFILVVLAAIDGRPGHRSTRPAAERLANAPPVPTCGPVCGSRPRLRRRRASRGRELEDTSSIPGPPRGLDRAMTDARPELPGAAVHPIRRTVRYVVARLVASAIVRSIFRVRVEGRDKIPAGQYLLCFSHESWVDPFVLMAVLPWRPRLYFFGPKEEDMSTGGRNRLMSWTGNSVPYRPGKNDLLDATRRVQTVFAAGGVLAIAGEGRIHAREDEVLPLNEGAAYFALRARVPIVPVAINGLTWFTVGSRVRIRIGEPIAAHGRPSREAVEALTAATWATLRELVAGFRPPERPGRFGRWLTEVFNDWPEGERPE